MNSNKEKILESLESFKTVMFGTHNVNGKIDFRPMAVACKREDDFYFIASQQSHKVEDVQQTGVVTLTAQSADTYLYVEGKAYSEIDRALLKEIWGPSLQAWFPNGPEDQEVALIRFKPIHGEIWDTNFISKAKYMWEMLSSNITGKKAEMEDQHKSF